ncbi:MAG: hypothetical protein VKJ24_14525 [Synechococcales bacterium]|nr:hypothetical protein [Synechococcales bacterium]
MMRLDRLPNWLDRLGNWNPQLLRELRGKITPSTVSTTVLLTLLGQTLLLLFFWEQLPTAQQPNQMMYCLTTWQEGVGCVIQWAVWWNAIQTSLYNILPYAILIPIVFLLAIDFFQEQQKGTLKFLRLSPRSADSILVGKLLGVPILIYLALALTVPLHSLSILLAGRPWHFILSYYSVWGAWGLLLAIAVPLSVLSQSPQMAENQNLTGISAGTGLVALFTFLGMPAIALWNHVTFWGNYLGSQFNPNITNYNPIPRYWFLLNINQHPGIAHLFLFGHLAIVIAFLWRIFRRAFAQPTATTLSKRQSYGLVTYLTLFAIGWFFIEIQGTTKTPLNFNHIAVFSTTGTFAFLLLIALLSTPRQMVLDGLRLQQERYPVENSAEHSSVQNSSDRQHHRSRQTRLWQIRNYLVAEKSPGVVAIAVNLMIFGLLLVIAWGIANGLEPGQPNYFNLAMGLEDAPLFGAWGLLIMSLVLIANYALLVQLILLLRTQKPYIWTYGCLTLVIGLPSLCSVIFGEGGRWLAYFTPFLWWVVDSEAYYLPNYLITAMFAFILLWAVLILQIKLLRWRLGQLNRSLQNVT